MRPVKDPDVESVCAERRAQPHRPFRRFLRDDSPGTWRAWVFFCCALVFATIQAIPGWTHPDLLLDWPAAACFGLVGVAGAVTGLIVARYRFVGLLAGALAGAGSLLAAVVVFHDFNHFPRTAVVIVEMLGLLPGLAIYCLLHGMIEFLTAQSNTP